MIREIVDVLGNELQVGDMIAFGDTTSTNNAVICTGKIEEINPKQNTVEVLVEVIKNGGWNHYNQYRRFIYPRNYNNIVKIN